MAFLDSIGNAISSVVNTVTDTVGSVLGGVADTVGNAVGISGLGEVVQTGFDAIGQVGTSLLDPVGTILGGASSGNYFSGGLGGLLGGASGILGGLANLFPSFGQPPSLSLPHPPGMVGFPPVPAPSTTSPAGSTVPGSINQINNMSLDQLQSSTDALMNKALSGKELTKNEQLALQQEMQRMNELFSLLSNLLKMQHDARQSMIGSMR